LYWVFLKKGYRISRFHVIIFFTILGCVSFESLETEKMFFGRDFNVGIATVPHELCGLSGMRILSGNFPEDC
jgi:hypothetical protein